MKVTGCSAVGSALGSGPRGRMFKSCHSDQKERVVCTALSFCLEMKAALGPTKRAKIKGVPKIVEEIFGKRKNNGAIKQF